MRTVSKVATSPESHVEGHFDPDKSPKSHEKGKKHLEKALFRCFLSGLVLHGENAGRNSDPGDFLVCPVPARKKNKTLFFPGPHPGYCFFGVDFRYEDRYVKTGS